MLWVSSNDGRNLQEWIDGLFSHWPFWGVTFCFHPKGFKSFVAKAGEALAMRPIVVRAEEDRNGIFERIAMLKECRDHVLKDWR